MKNVLYFVLFAFVFTACQKDETSELIPETPWTQKVEIPTETGLKLIDAKSFRAAIILETAKGEDTFNEIDLGQYPEAWTVNPEGKLIPNIDVIQKLLDYTTISKHNEKPVLNQSIAIYPGTTKSVEVEAPAFSCLKAFYTAAANTCNTNQVTRYDCGAVSPVKVCKGLSNTCLVFDSKNFRFFALLCNS